ncbi:MAG: hypothetical protein GY909_09350 [Oligoflexia bacterium]|nr:hypothetical protein [Oligoflexia bacterium]
MGKHNFSGELGKYSFIKTDDGSLTLHSEIFDENCHSTDGAVEETLFNYIHGCRVTERIKENNHVIFELGLGLGIGYITTVNALPDDAKNLTFISCEIDPGLITYLIENGESHGHENYPEFRDLKKEDGIWTAKKNENQLFIIEGDIRKEAPHTFKQLGLKFDSIYQDPFSPKKNPTLWTWQWFELLKNYSHSKTILSTYSASVSVRKAMAKAGWKVHNQKGFGRKKSKTLCLLEGDHDPNLINTIEKGKANPLADESIIG